MYIAPVDRAVGEEEWRPFVEAQGFGHLVAAGRDRDAAVVVPTQFVLQADEVILHLARPNPIFEAIAEQATVLLSVAGDWAFIPSDWKAIDGEDPALGIPTTYYAAVQMVGRAEVLDDPAEVAAILRRQLEVSEPGSTAADPEVAHLGRLRAIRAIRIPIDEVRAKFKYGGNVDAPHREAVISLLARRGRPGDLAAAAHTARRSAAARQPSE